MDRMPSKPVTADAFEKRIALPPIPHIESMPWMKWNAGVNALKVDTLMPQAPSYWLSPASGEVSGPPLFGS
jgi:hypothetical protein